MLDAFDRAVGKNLLMVETLADKVPTIVETLGLITATVIDFFFALIDIETPILTADWPTPGKTIRTETCALVGFLVEPSAMRTNTLNVLF